MIIPSYTLFSDFKLKRKILQLMNKLVPNSFQIPNAIVDDFIKLMNGNELKIYLIIVRKTRGWNKEFDGISISQFIKYSGINSHNTIRKALKNLSVLNLIKEIKQDGKYSMFYLSDPYQKMTVSKNNIPDSAPLPKNDNDPYQKMTIQKDTTKEEEERRKKFFEDFYLWLPKNRVKTQKWHKQKVKQNLLNGDDKTVENFKEFMTLKNLKNHESNKNNIANEQFKLLCMYLETKTQNQILQAAQNQEFIKVFESETCNFILKKNGLVAVASSLENKNYHTWMLQELQKEYK